MEWYDPIPLDLSSVRWSMLEGMALDMLEQLDEVGKLRQYWTTQLISDTRVLLGLNHQTETAERNAARRLVNHCWVTRFGHGQDLITILIAADAPFVKHQLSFNTNHPRFVWYENLLNQKIKRCPRIG
jgi:hypothetical protein